MIGLILRFFWNLNSNCSNIWDMRNLQEQVKKAFCYQKFFWPFTVWINCSSDLKNFENSLPSASNFKSFSQSLEQFFLTVDQNNFGNKISLPKEKKKTSINWKMNQFSGVWTKVKKGDSLTWIFFRKNILDTWMNVKQGDAAIGYLLLKHTFSNFFVSIKGFWMM